MTTGTIAIAMSDRASAPRRSTRWAGILAALFGVGLFAYVIHRTRLDPIVAGLRSVGWGFLVVIVLSGLRVLARATAWRLCTEDRGLRVRDTFPAFLTGEALGNLTPLGLFVSEPTKAVFVRDRVPLMTAVSGLAIENLFYTLSVAGVIAAGTVAMLFSFNVTRDVRLPSLVLLGGMLALLAVSAIVLAREIRVVTPLLDTLNRRRLVPASLVARLEKLRALEARIYNFHRRQPDRLLPVIGLEIAYHAAGVAEVWVILACLVGPPSLLMAFVLETANRATNVIFKFVPMRLGVDEVGTAWLTQMMGYPTAVGVTLAIVRKLRIAFWTLIGVVILALRGLRRDEVTALAMDAAAATDREATT